MDVSARLVSFVGGHEGRVLRAYRDPVHVVTIGFGFTWNSARFREWWMARRGHKLRMGDVMTTVEAVEVLLLLLREEYGPPVAAKFRGQTQNVVEGGTSTVYNCGPGALDWQWADLLSRGSLAAGAARLRTTATTARGKRLPGLVRRRAEEADIVQYNRWPDWVTDGGVPETHVTKDDIQQAQRWLNELGYPCGEADGVPGRRTVEAVRRFQTDHGQLRVDGIVGPATLAALQRAIDLRRKAGQAGAGAGGAVVAGGAEQTTGAGGDVVLPPDLGGGTLDWLGPVLLWGGAALFVAALVYLAWRYQDEINVALRRFF